MQTPREFEADALWVVVLTLTGLDTDHGTDHAALDGSLDGVYMAREDFGNLTTC